MSAPELLDQQPPEFFRWLVKQYLDKEYFGIYGRRNGIVRLATRTMRGTWIPVSRTRKREVPFMASEEDCLKAAIEAFNNRKL